VDGKSGLIDRDGNMVIEPKYGFIEAIGPDRFRVAEERQRGGTVGSEDFSGRRVKYTADGGISSSGVGLIPGFHAMGVIDLSGRWIEPLMTSRAFDKDDPSMRWVQRDGLWGLSRPDGSWFVAPKFQQVGPLVDGLARVTMNGKVGFIDRGGSFVIDPVFDKAWGFEAGFDRTSAQRDEVFGVIDRTGTWVFQTNYQQVHVATARGKDRKPEAFGWHYKQADRWGLLDLDGRIVLEADFDQGVHQCPDGRLIAYRNKEWLYFTGNGSPLQPPDGRLIDATCGGVPPYTLKVGDKFGLVDAASRPVTPEQFDAVVRAGRDARNVKLDGKWGRIGPDSRWLLEPKFAYLSTESDIFVASIDGKRGFMRSDGSWLIEPKFDAAARRRDSETAFVTVAGATGVLRLTDQSWVVPPQSGVMCNISNGNAILWQNDGRRTILSPSGETWIDIGAERIGISLDYGLLAFLQDGKWGLVDTAGQITTEPQFDEPVYFMERLRGIAWAKRDGNWCAIDRRGRLVPGIACADADPTGPPTGRFECKVEP